MSAATVIPDLRAACRQRLLLLNDVNPTMMAWENEPFTPVPGQPFIAETFARTGGKPVLLGGNLRHDLLLTLTLFWPSGQGTIDIESMAGRLLEHFRPGVGVAYGSNKAKIASADQRRLLQEPVWTSCPVIVSMAAWTAND